MLVRHTNGLVSFDVGDDSPVVKEILKREAAQQLAEHPQYAGYHDGSEWYVVRFTKRVKTRLGVAFEAGDLALCRDRDEREAELSGCELPTAYSTRNRVHTAVRLNTFERVG